MPPPDPRSRTVWPAFSSINAVGLPQPSEAATAASGRTPRSPSLYRFEVISSVPQQPEPEQQLTSFAPAAALRAAAPYFSWIRSFNSVSVLMSDAPHKFA